MTLSKLKEAAADCIVGLHGGQAIWVGLQFSGVLGSYKTREIICTPCIFGRTLSAIRFCLFSFRRSFCRNNLQCTLVILKLKAGARDPPCYGWFLAVANVCMLLFRRLCSHVRRRTPRTLADALKLSVTQLRPLSCYMGAIMDRTM